MTPDQEHLIALAAQALSASAKTFTVFNNADLVFGSVKDKKGHEHTLSHGTYLLYLKSEDRTLRRNAFNGYSLKQVHHTVDPIGEPKIDLPVRLFRNNKGIKFFIFLSIIYYSLIIRTNRRFIGLN